MSLSDYDGSPINTDLVIDSVDADGKTTISNPTEELITDVHLSVVCFAADGTILGGASDFPEQVGPGSKVLAEPFLQVSGQAKSCEATVHAAPL